MFSKLNLHLFRRKKIENRLKNDRFIQFFGFTVILAKICWKQIPFSTFDQKTKKMDKSVIFQAIFDFFLLLNRCKFNFENMFVYFCGFCCSLCRRKFKSIYFSIFCENHSTSNCSKTNHFGPNFMKEGFLEFKLQGEYFVIHTNND